MADKNEDYDSDSDSDVSVTQLKGTNKRKLLIGHGPTTRSPANAAAKPGTEDASEKEGTCPSIQLEISANPLIELPQVADATEKKKAKKEKVAATTSKKVVTNTVFIVIEEGDVPVSVPQRMRGKTRMDKVHTRSRDKRLKKINEKFSIVDAPDELLSDRIHGPHWLLWKCVKPSKVSSSNAPRDTYVNKLTTKIKQGVVAEVEEKVKQIQEEVDEQVNTKVQKNLASVIKKIREANPNIKIDI
ncbi:hypothetical protein POM88_000674 [Heracleum sosnowskyi]|uniref:Uncharacterized protein n=1 Tax=Heracleum sosnowskyi TaxID=360622 RepID=A0AAD8JCN7_9APIA|nr:hypothetical protein POM88_000674 [Heracleum sosnowskyi]